MPHRLKALFLLFIFGLVLPVAGAPQRFCVLRGVWLMPQQACCGGCCEQCPEDEESPLDPDCVKVAKMVPDIMAKDHVARDQAQAPVFVFTCGVPVVAPCFVEAPVSCEAAPLFFDRGPPGPVPIYLAHRSLLI